MPAHGVTAGNVWVSDSPGDAQRNWIVLKRGTPVTVLAAYGAWIQISWLTEDDVVLTGWVPSRWIELFAPIPAHYITPLSLP
ncbi:MAG: hypothetical protein B6D38_07615 [Anaerolineae bacterium UTCFX1]|nr:MAG: hypothetical protein B6D38_07615 [Anaerolineae bacterium UTCFX1]